MNWKKNKKFDYFLDCHAYSTQERMLMVCHEKWISWNTGENDYVQCFPRHIWLKLDNVGMISFNFNSIFDCCNQLIELIIQNSENRTETKHINMEFHQIFGDTISNREGVSRFHLIQLKINLLMIVANLNKNGKLFYTRENELMRPSSVLLASRVPKTGSVDLENTFGRWPILNVDRWQNFGKSLTKNWVKK